VGVGKKFQNLYSILISCIIGICLCPSFISPGLVDSSYIATPGAFVPINNLKVGDKVFSYNFNARPEEFLIEVAVKKIECNNADSVFSFWLEGERRIHASPQQMIFTARQEIDEEENIHFIIELTQAQYLMPGQLVIDWNLNLIPITLKIKRILYEERRIYQTYLFG